MSLLEYRKKVESGEVAANTKKLNPRERFLKNKTRKTAIHAFCFNCLGECEGYMNEIRNCTAKDCSLYDFRPYK